MSRHSCHGHWAHIALVAFALGACEERSEASGTAEPGAPAATSTTSQARPEPLVEAPPEAVKPEPVPETVAAQHILITFRGAKNAPGDVKRSKTDAETLAKEVYEKAKSGKDFTALVAEYSEDVGTKERLGSLGKFKPEGMVKPFSDAAFSLSVNEVSEPVETEFGFHVIKRNQ